MANDESDNNLRPNIVEVKNADDGIERKPANENPWYILATLHGEQEDDYIDADLHKKNRESWNRFMATLYKRNNKYLKKMKKWAEIKDENGEKRFSAEELKSLSNEEFEEIKILFDKRNGDWDNLIKKLYDKVIIDFSNTVFDKTSFVVDSFIFIFVTYFNNCLFKMPAKFESAEFNDYASFRKTEFNSYANFGEAKFNDYVDFKEVKFNYFTTFEKTEFNKNANFGKAKFNYSLIYFRKAKFNDGAIFDKAEFNCYADFSEAKFNDGAIFSEAKFNGKAEFNSSTFNEANFREATFSKETNFKSATFKSSLTFSNVKFLTNPPDFNGCPTIYEGTIWSKRKENWPDTLETIKNLPREENETEESYKERHSVIAEQHKSCYERLKKDAESHKKHDLELFFFSKQLDCEKILNESLFDRALIKCYNLFSGYGFSIAKPLAWLGFLCSFCALLFFVDSVFLEVYNSPDQPKITQETAILLEKTVDDPSKIIHALIGDILLMDDPNVMVDNEPRSLLGIFNPTPPPQPTKLSPTYVKTCREEMWNKFRFAVGYSLLNTFSFIPSRKEFFENNSSNVDDVNVKNFVNKLSSLGPIIATLQIILSLPLWFLFALALRNRFRMK